MKKYFVREIVEYSLVIEAEDEDDAYKQAIEFKYEEWDFDSIIDSSVRELKH